MREPPGRVSVPSASQRLPSGEDDLARVGAAEVLAGDRRQRQDLMAGPADRPFRGPAGHLAQRPVENLDAQFRIQDHHPVRAVLDDGVQLLFLGADLLVELRVAHGDRSLIGERRQHAFVVRREGDAAAAKQVDHPQQPISENQRQGNHLVQRQQDGTRHQVEARLQIGEGVLLGLQREISQQRGEAGQ